MAAAQTTRFTGSVSNSKGPIANLFAEFITVQSSFSVQPSDALNFFRCPTTNNWQQVAGGTAKNLPGQNENETTATMRRRPANQPASQSVSGSPIVYLSWQKLDEAQLLPGDRKFACHHDDDRECAPTCWLGGIEFTLVAFFPSLCS